MTYLVLSQADASVIPPPPPDSAGAVFTATQILNTVISEAPYLTVTTKTVVWTESAAPSATTAMQFTA
ncbi:hypothetical protein HWV62_42110 [Athelia sp. TMB]|nr:hypothetical protein HWV62_42110 [Athelia sp. TMB]